MPIRFAALLMAGAMLSSPALAQSPAGSESVIATVNGTPITETDVQSMYEALPDQFRQMPISMLRPQLIDRVIESELMMQAGESSGLENDPEVLEQLAALKRQVIAQAFVGQAIDKAITNEALQAEYELLVEELPPQDRVSASHILLKTEDEAKAVIEELQSGADFAEVAKEKSVGPSGPNGGALGSFQFGDMVAPFAQAAFAMEEGSFSQEPVETQFGWHVILVTGKEAGEAPSQAEVRAELEARISQKAIAALREELRANADIQMTEQP